MDYVQIAKDQIPIAGQLGSALLSVTAFVVSYLGYRLSRRNSTTNVAQSLHTSLFRDRGDVKLLYRSYRESEHYFSSNERGDTENFLGSKLEPQVDHFLERLNFVCMWLLRHTSKGSDEELLFKKYILKLYEAPLFQQYFTFLDNVDDEQGDRTRIGQYYGFIHEYAKQRLGLERPQVKYATSREELIAARANRR